MRVFRPKYDWWMVALPLAVLALVHWLVLGEVWVDWAVYPGSRAAQISYLVLLSLVDIFFAVLYLGTRYCLERGALVVQVGFWRWRWPILSVREGGWWALISSVRRPRLRLAFSADNLIVSVQGRWIKEVVISPREKGEFLSLVRRRRR